MNSEVQKPNLPVRRIHLRDACKQLGNGGVDKIKTAALKEEIEIVGLLVIDFTEDDRPTGGLVPVPSSFIATGVFRPEIDRIENEQGIQPGGEPESYTCYVHCCINRDAFNVLFNDEFDLAQASGLSVKAKRGRPSTYSWELIATWATGVADRAIAENKQPPSFNTFVKLIRKDLESRDEEVPSEPQLKKKEEIRAIAKQYRILPES